MAMVDGTYLSDISTEGLTTAPTRVMEADNDTSKSSFFPTYFICLCYYCSGHREPVVSGMLIGEKIARDSYYM